MSSLAADCWATVCGVPLAPGEGDEPSSLLSINGADLALTLQ
jgi:hypothetical protein